jgi:uncharacterized protein (TIRG00374 family)
MGMTTELTDNGGRKHPAAVFLGRALRVVVAGGLLWLAARGVDFTSFRDSLAQASPGWLLAAVLLVLADRALMVTRWLLLLRTTDPPADVSAGQVLRVFLVSSFIATFIPAGSLGGDTLRVVGLSRLKVRTAHAVGSVVVDRLLGSISVLVTAVVGLLLLGQVADSRLLAYAIVVFGGVTLAALLLLFDSRVLSGLVEAAAGSRLPTLRRLGQKFLAAVRQYGQHRTVLATVLACSVAVQLLRVLQAWCLGLALGIGIGGLWYFAFIPIIVMVVLLPISMFGIGTGNYTFVALFAVAGVARADALALSVLFLALGVLGNLPGGLLVALDPKWLKPQRKETA